MCKSQVQIRERTPLGKWLCPRQVYIPKGWINYNCWSNIIGLVTDCTDWSTLHHFPLSHLTQSIDRKIVPKEGFFCSDKGSAVSQTSLTLLQIVQFEGLRFTLIKWTGCTSWSNLCHLDRLNKLKTWGSPWLNGQIAQVEALCHLDRLYRLRA